VNEVGMTGYIELLSMGVFLLVFLVTSGLGFALFVRAYGDDRRVRDRLRSLTEINLDEEQAPSGGLARLARSTFPRLGALLLPSKEESLSRLKVRLLQAGLYSPNALKVFYGVKLTLLLVLPLLVALLPFSLGVYDLRWALFASSLGSAAGIMLPNFWLARHMARRQRELRRALPDALDMLVLCLEGGLSLTAALQRVTSELQEVHPTLGTEMSIVQQTSQLGLSIGEAFKQFGQRCDLAEVRDLASVLLQSERFGSGVVKSLRTYADHFREERQQRAEEQAQVAAVKILFPMLVCIFPAIFIVLLGPAAFQIAKMFNPLR
jgi:tight adherence protein C